MGQLYLLKEEYYKKPRHPVLRQRLELRTIHLLDDVKPISLRNIRKKTAKKGINWEI